MSDLQEQMQELEWADELHARQARYSDFEEQDLRPLTEKFPTIFTTETFACSYCGADFEQVVNVHVDPPAVYDICGDCLAGGAA